LKERGYLPVSRKLFTDDEPFWDEQRVFSRWEAWMDLIQQAAFEPRRRSLEGTVFHLQRGEVLGSLRFFAARWRWSEATVRRFLAQLRRMERISVTKATHAGTIYLLTNYETYNPQRRDDETDVTQPRRSNDAAATQPRNGRETVVTQPRRKIKELEELEERESVFGAPAPETDLDRLQREQAEDAWIEGVCQKVKAVYPKHRFRAGERVVYMQCRKGAIRPDDSEPSTEHSVTESELLDRLKLYVRSGEWRRGIIPALETFFDDRYFLADPGPDNASQREDVRRTAGAHDTPQPSLVRRFA
jgi:hypothetical protein